MTRARPSGTLLPLLAFAVLACVFGWMFIIGSAVTSGAGSGQFPLGPIMAAAAVSAALGWSGLRTWGRQLGRLGAAPGWYLFALLAPVVLLGAAVLVNAALGAPLPSAAQLADGAALGPTFIGILIGIGIGEEAGWTAFAAPRLFATNSFVRAWLALSVMRTVWHLPLMLQGDLSLTLGIGGNFAFQFLVLWLMQRTGVWLLAALWHTVLNTIGGSFLFGMVQGADQERLGLLMVIGYWMLVGAVVALDRGRLNRAPVPVAAA